MSGQAGSASDLVMSSGKKSVGADLENLGVNLGGADDDELQDDLRISEIRAGNSSNKKANQADDIAEMEKLLKSGRAFGG